MKKRTLLTLGLVAVLGLGLVSCKKNCNCKAKYVNWTDYVPYLDTNKTTKKKDCKDYMDYQFDMYGDYEPITYTCTWGK